MAKRIVKKRRSVPNTTATQHVREHAIQNVQLARLMNGEMKPNNQKMLEMRRDELIEELHEQYSRIEYYHYYLIFLLEMMDAKIMLCGVNLDYDIPKETFRLNRLRKNIDRVNDPDITIETLNTITYSICEAFIDIMGHVCREINKTEKYNKVIRSVIIARSRYLQMKPDGTRFTAQESYSEVIRVSAITYLCKNTTRVGLPRHPFPETIAMPDGEV